MQQSSNEFNNFAYQNKSAYARKSLFGLKNLITIFVVIEAITALILFSLYVYFFNSIVQVLGVNQANSKAIASFLLAIVTYLLWKTFMATYITLKFVRNANEFEISANRYVFVALSLSLGGWLTPFMLTSLPNMNVQSTLNPRYFITKNYGLISGIGSLIALATYFISLKIGVNALNNEIIFQNQTLINSLTIGVLALTVSIAAFGFLSFFAWKWEEKRSFDFAQSSSLFKVISTIWLAIVSVEVFLTLVYAIVRFIGLLSTILQALSHQRTAGAGGLVFGFLMFPIFMMQIAFQLLYVVWIAYIVKQTISGLWQPQVGYRTFESLARYSEKTIKTKTN